MSRLGYSCIDGLRLETVERADRLVAADAADRLSKELCNADDAYLLTLLRVRYRIGEDHLRQARLVDALCGRVTHDGMCREGSDRLSPML